ncbi:MAG: hypothetical protein ACREO1_05340 [Arenimonas sp.]
MNAYAYADNVASLRLPVSYGAARRNELNGKPLKADAIVHFNALLRTLYRRAESVNPDSLVSLARDLQKLPAEQVTDMIAERISRAETLRRMTVDKDWIVDSKLRVRARLLLAYLDKHEDLIPDGNELFGHLDDALMIELSWPSFKNAVDEYREFTAYREDNPSDSPLTAWQNHNACEAAWRRKADLQREHSYVSPINTRLFRVL